MRRRRFIKDSWKWSGLLFLPKLIRAQPFTFNDPAFLRQQAVASGGGSTVVYDLATVQANLASTNTTTFSHTCTGTNLALVVWVASEDAGQSVSTVTYNGVSMSAIGSATFGGTGKLEAWGLAAPASGAHNVVVTMSASIANWDAVAISFTGANQSGGSSTFGGFGSQAGSGLAALTAVTITSATSDLVTDCTLSTTNDGTTSSGTQRWQDNTGGTNTQGATAAGAATVIVTENWTGNGSANTQNVAGLSVHHA